VVATLVLSAAVASVAEAGGSGLAAWWKLDDGSGTLAADSSGNGNDGALQGNGTWIEGVLDGAWQGDGDGDYIRVPHSESLNLSDAVTVSMWSYGGIAPDQLICKGNDGAAWVSSYSIRVDDDGSHARQLNWRGRVGSSPDALNSKTALPTAEWIHIAITFDVAAEGNNQKIYLNGVLDAESRSTTPLSTNTADVLLGADGYTTTRWHWQGRLDDIRIYSVALSASQIPLVMTGAGFGAASSPRPDDQATDVPRDTMLAWEAGPTAVTHDVYLDAGFDDVNIADRSNPLDVLVSRDQAGLDFVPAGLEYGQTYYWRVDEVNGAPDHTVFTGSVWSFTVEPYAYPVANVTATASSEAAGTSAQNTANGVGLNADDQHSVELKEMWMTVGGFPAWIQYEFDKVYKFQEMWVWNSNQMIEAFLGFGAKDVTVECSTDGMTWTAVADVPQFAKATGTAACPANTVVDFAGAEAKYVRLTITSNWGGMAAQTGVSEVRFFHVPVLAREPQPADARTEVGLDATLDWRPGREATSHAVYFGTDSNAVAEGTATTKTVDSHTFAPTGMEYGVQYFWRVDEVGDAGTYAGDVWSFTSQEFTAAEDFEAYNDDDNRIFDVWIDGVTTEASGSQVGYDESPFAEKAIARGKQSMPMTYDNTESPYVSEAEREFDPAQNWTGNGASEVCLWTRGYPAVTTTTITETNGKMTVTGAGADIYDNTDDFTYAYKTLNGDGTIIARVTSTGTGSSTWAKGGVMIRDGFNGGSAHAMMVITTPGANGASFQYRTTTDGASATADSTVAVAPPYWVKIERAGSNFTGYHSADGNAWSTVGSTIIEMADPVLIGIAVTSHEDGVDRTFEFDGITTTGTVAGAWQGAIIDAPQFNDAAAMYLTITDSAGKSATVTSDTAALTADWTRWAIPMSDFAGVNFAKVQNVIIGIGTKGATAPGGKGIVFIDDIGYGRSAQ
jgi:hypothetical protein